MKIQSLLNGGVAEVSDEYGKRLVAGPHWAVAGAKAEPAVKRRRSRAVKEEAPVEEPESEE